MDFETAVVIIAPHTVQAFAIPLMRQYCFESMLRVPAHITILFPFVPLDDLDAACWKLRDICAGIAPFEVTLDGYGHFPTTTYLAARPGADQGNLPGDPRGISRLPAVSRRVRQRRHHAAHDRRRIRSVAEREQAVYPPYEPITFRVRRLHLVVGVERMAILDHS
ncbi:MAG: 2'-5' RNA ligase family protein [Anaerolineae bacterium]